MLIEVGLYNSYKVIDVYGLSTYGKVLSKKVVSSKRLHPDGLSDGLENKLCRYAMSQNPNRLSARRIPMTDSMQWANALSTRPSLEAAVNEAVDIATAKLKGELVDLGIVFISSAFASEFSRLLPLLQQRLNIPTILGCSGGGVIGSNELNQTEEWEASPALSLTLARLPGVEITPFHLNVEELPDLDASPDAWIDLIGVSPQSKPLFLLFSGAFVAGINNLLQGLDFAYPDSPILGGQAAGGGFGSQLGLFLNNRFHRDGLVGVALSGNIVMDTIVAQGCRPIGKPLQVTKSDRNIIIELDEQPPLTLLRDLISHLNEEDRRLAQNWLFVGIAMDEFKSELEPGDFLIRNILGVDPQAGAIAIGDRIRPGQRLQFHIRDAQSSAEDLELLLQRYKLEHSGQSYDQAAAFMFACMGRGESLYNQPNFDSQLFHRYFPTIPLVGFFCGGEIGPVGDRTHIHAFTSVIGICHQP